MRNGFVNLMTLSLVLGLTLGASQVAFAAKKKEATQAPAANKEVEEIQKQLVSLSDAGQKAKTDCGNFVNQAKQIVGQPPQQGPAINRKQALDLLALLKKYPGIPDASRQLWAGFYQQAQAREGLSPLPVLQSYSCEPMAWFEVVRLLVSTMDQVKLSNKERRELGDAVFEQAKKDLGSVVTLMPAQAALASVQLALDNKLIEASDVVYLEFLNMQDRVGEIREKLAEAAQKARFTDLANYEKFSAEQKRAVQQSILFELNQTARMASRASALLRRVK